MFVHGEQADTILASLLALMASLQSLSRCLVVRLSLVQHALWSSPSLIKSLLFLLSFTAHPKPVTGKILSETESGQQGWYRRHLFSWNACSRAARLRRSRYPDRNISKPVFSSFACITSHLLRWAMDEQLYEGGRVKDASALIGWRAMVCVWGKVPLAMLDKGGPLPPFLVRLPALSASLPCSLLCLSSSSSSSSSVFLSALQAAGMHPRSSTIKHHGIWARSRTSDMSAACSHIHKRIWRRDSDCVMNSQHLADITALAKPMT